MREYDTLTKIFNINENRELVVIHCAAIVYIKSKHNQDVYDVNVNGTKNIVKKVLEKNAKYNMSVVFMLYLKSLIIK